MALNLWSFCLSLPVFRMTGLNYGVQLLQNVWGNPILFPLMTMLIDGLRISVQRLHLFRILLSTCSIFCLLTMAFLTNRNLYLMALICSPWWLVMPSTFLSTLTICRSLFYFSPHCQQIPEKMWAVGRSISLASVYDSSVTEGRCECRIGFVAVVASLPDCVLTAKGIGTGG